jgi:hypothetical protein
VDDLTIPLLGEAIRLHSLPMALQATRHYRLCRCLRIRSACVVGNLLTVAKRLNRASRVLQAASSVGGECPCCAPIIDRNMAFLLSYQGRHREALATVQRAIDAMPRCPICRTFRAWIRHNAKLPGSTEDLCFALQKCEPGTFYHDGGIYNLAAILAMSRSVQDLERAYAILPLIRFDGCEDASLQRAHLSWLQGTVRLALAHHRPAESRKLRKSAWEHLVTACRRFHALGLEDLHAAAWADRAATLAISARKVGARKSFRRLIAYPLSRRPVPPPFGRFRAPSLPILDGDPLPLRKFRMSTGQPPAIVPYPE